MAKNRSREEEPSIAPKPDRWYNLSLGQSFRDHNPSSKFCTLRYEFKPASVDKSRDGSLHKTKDNKVTVEFQNNQHGKPKVIFEGVTEDYKDNDAVLFFDGESLCLEQLHRAVKRLRHVRDLGEATASSGGPITLSVGATAESYPPSVGKAANDQFSDKEPPKVEVDDVNVESDDPESVMNQLYGVKTEEENLMDSPPAEGNTSTEIPDATKYESDENIDIIDDHDGYEVAKEEDEVENRSRAEVHRGIEIDINIPHQDDEEDFEIADVDVSDGEVNNTGFNAAEALRAQVAGEREKGSSSSCSSSSSSSSGSSSSSSSGSGSSSDSGSASSDSASSHDESVTSV